MSTRPGAFRVALLAFAISFAVLVANGRAIGSGDTNAIEKTATALSTHGSFILPDEGTPDPFTRDAGGGRISIYPALPALLAAPFFFVFGLFFDLNLTGAQVAGKLFAALLAAIAISLMAGSFARRASPPLALVSALLFGLGTSVYSTAQALWQHPAALVFLVIALRALERVEALPEPETLRPGIVAAVSLVLAMASRPAVIPMCALLFAFLIYRTRAHALPLIGAACVPAAALALYNATFFGAPFRFGPGLSGRFFAALPESIPGLLVSPARGLFMFTPIAFLGFLGLGRQMPKVILARGLAAAVFTHFAFMATWNEWHGGESFGPRLLTDLLPPLFFFLPEALSRWPRVSGTLGFLSIGIQLLGGWTYDYRWERLHQRGRDFDAALWSFRDSPIAFAVREGVVIQGHPVASGRRLRMPLLRLVPFGPSGSRIEATASGLRISGEALVRDVRMERGARILGGWVNLSHPGDAIAFRSVRGGMFGLRVVGSVTGSITSSSGSQGGVSVETRDQTTAARVTGDFDLDLPLRVSPGDEVFVRAQSGELRFAWIELRKVELKP